MEISVNYVKSKMKVKKKQENKSWLFLMQIGQFDIWKGKK